MFSDYGLTEAPRAGPAAALGEALSFSLGGLSKSAGLPSWKLGWIRVGGPPELRRRTVAALEMVADTYLSVATPVQRALAGVLELAPRIRTAILGRVRGNLAVLRAALAALPAVELLEPEGGWAAVIRVSLPGGRRRGRWSWRSSSARGCWFTPAITSISRRRISSCSPCCRSPAGSPKGWGAWRGFLVSKRT